MTSDDLKQVLQSVATQGTDTVELDEHALVPRIRRRRRRRTAAVGVAGFAGAAAIAVSAYAVLPGAGTESTVANRGGGSQSAIRENPLPPYKCGVTFPAPSSIGTRGEKVTQKTMARSADGWTGTVEDEFTSHLPKPLMNASPTSLFAVVQKNRVVGHAVLTGSGKPVVLQPEQSHTFRARIDIRSCDRTPGARLPVGSYLIYRDLPADSKPQGGTLKEVLPTAQLQLK
ncbi:hypothetical protein EV644_103269 [Kribbella orskensis]|uniref:Uncharacterized protein n=1 Tax=Kribbella orskensis TaxID=2512216 RepID=A0ABY2BQ02_9ACTN|nr:MULTISPECIES: hypothetical protein [Kribbella]TCN39647.1 hypothetical protein EV642_106151 [Kribbella sp. VKM Ac-2500]TCO27570.1 hypothetical protein EV644_103269 [Kribbella orskensis]